MTDNLSNAEKTQLGYKAIEAFIDQFQPLDDTAIMFLTVILELLYNSKPKIGV